MVDNTVTIVGTITMDPELRTTNSGMSVLDINFAGPKKRRFTDGEWVNVDDDPQYFSGVVFGQQAENVSSSLTKGMNSLLFTSTLAQVNISPDRVDCSSPLESNIPVKIFL